MRQHRDGTKVFNLTRIAGLRQGCYLGQPRLAPAIARRFLHEGKVMHGLLTRHLAWHEGPKGNPVWTRGTAIFLSSEF